MLTVCWLAAMVRQMTQPKEIPSRDNGVFRDCSCKKAEPYPDLLLEAVLKLITHYSKATTHATAKKEARAGLASAADKSLDPKPDDFI